MKAIVRWAVLLFFGLFVLVALAIVIQGADWALEPGATDGHDVVTGAKIFLWAVFGFLAISWLAKRRRSTPTSRAGGDRP